MEVVSEHLSSSHYPVKISKSEEIIKNCDLIESVNEQIQFIASIDNERIVERRRAIIAQEKLYDEIITNLNQIHRNLSALLAEEEFNGA